MNYSEMNNEQLIHKAEYLANTLTRHNMSTRIPADFWEKRAEFDKIMVEYSKRGLTFDRDGYAI